MKTVERTQPGAAEDQRLAELVEEIAELLQSGGSSDVDEYIARYPEYADRLHDWVNAMSAMADLGHSLIGGGQSRSESDVRGPVTGVLGDFRILRELGRGGMGVVYEAEQISLGRRVALKVLPFAAMLDKQQLARFKNEARAAATLDHPNIVAIYSVGTERGVHYYAMQLIEGQSLAEIIADLRQRRGGPAEAPAIGGLTLTAVLAPSGVGPLHETGTAEFRAAETKRDLQAALSTLPDFDSREYFRAVARLGIQAAEALDHAHQNGVLHRDVKPGNLMVDDAGKLWITDFGLARIEQDAGMTMTGDILGTLRYMSPEQALAKRVVVDHRSDIYSLGATLYELLTLQPIFAGDDRQELLRQIAFEEPRRPRQTNARIPQDIETIVLKAIEKNAADRYGSAQELADDLQRFLENKMIAARPPTHRQRIAKWARRHVAILSIAVAAWSVAGVACLAAALLTLRAYRSESEHRTAAEANLTIASESIDRMLSRVADDQYHHGDLAHAETVAADATEFYEKLLTHSDDPELRFRAAEAHGTVAEIWLLVDKPEKALAAGRRSIDLVRPLIGDNPREAKYLNARAAAYLSLGRAEWGLGRLAQAEEPWRQAAADFQRLIDTYPHEPKFQGSLASTLNNLGMFCWVCDRVDGAEQHFQRVIEIVDQLPPSLADAPEVWTMTAAALCNWAMLARERGDPTQALELLDKAKGLLKRALDAQPTDPVAIDFLFNHFWQTAKTSVSAGQPGPAAKTVDALVRALPDRLDAYYLGAALLLNCAELAESSPTVHGGVKGRSTSTADPAVAAAYRDRARELIAKAHEVPASTPEKTDAFACFLLTCQDKSFRDPPRALELAQCAVDEARTRGGLWFTLALAHYRLGAWQAAEDALQKSIDLTPGSAPSIHHLLLGSMIRFQLGRIDEARQWHKRSIDSLAKNQTSNDDTLTLAAEANELILDARRSSP